MEIHALSSINIVILKLTISYFFRFSLTEVIKLVQMAEQKGKKWNHFNQQKTIDPETFIKHTIIATMTTTNRSVALCVN